MTFSIVMPALNGARFIGEAIASIEAQTDSDWELIIVDGGSTDGGLEIAKARADKDSRIRVFTGPDSGMYDALLKGFAAARGDWLSWLNSDDLYTPWALASVRRHVGAHGGEWVTGAPGCWDESGRLRSVRPAGRYIQTQIAAGWHHDHLLGYLQQESMFFSRSLFERLSDEDLARIRAMRFAGDFLMWRLFASHAPLNVIPSVLGGFRRHGGNMSAANSQTYRDEAMSTAPFAPPAFIARPLALLSRVASAWAWAKLADRADRELLAEIERPRA
ncbi:MAG: glycosyltransferase family 2 protein [Parvularculaceae bacterium]